MVLLSIFLPVILALTGKEKKFTFFNHESLSIGRFYIVPWEVVLAKSLNSRTYYFFSP